MPSSMKDFRVIAALGKGSYGSVMKVERIADGATYAVKEVAIKRLSPRERWVQRTLAIVPAGFDARACCKMLHDHGSMQQSRRHCVW